MLWQTRVSDIALASIACAVVTLISPIAGWLADVYFGRYKVLKYSIWIMCISSMLLTLNSVVTEFSNGYKNSSYIIEVIMLIVAITGFAGFVSNLMQFVLDQLQDASTEEIVSVIKWFAWTNFTSNAALNYALFCVNKNYQLIGMLVVSASLTLGVCSDILFSNNLIKVPAMRTNPFRLVFDVVKYAIRTKTPRYRSAFTYCEDERPSRIDFGKHKFGGPFTTEQVEDVKTFLRLLVIVVISGALPGPSLFLEYTESKLINQFLDPEAVVDGCYTAKNLSTVTVVCGFLSIPLYEFLVQPMLYKCIPAVSSHWKVFLSLIFLLLKVTAFMAIDLVCNQVDKTSVNQTTVCIFNDGLGKFKDVLDYRYFSLFEIIDVVSTTLIIIGIVEFFCSQVPYSMKGAFVGIVISILSVCSATGVAVLIPFTLELSIWKKSILSCGFWCFFSEAVIISTGIFLTMAAIRWYKKRKREDVLPNEQMFAERYYSS